MKEYLTIANYCSTGPIGKQLSTKTEKSTIAIFRSTFSFYGIPQKIVSANGSLLVPSIIIFLAKTLQKASYFKPFAPQVECIYRNNDPDRKGARPYC